jgi:hypothetical protein
MYDQRRTVMRLFKTNPYRNAEGVLATNMFFVLDDVERDNLATMLILLLEDIDAGLAAKTLKWNKWDAMSLDFLKRCCLYGEYEEAEMMDLSSKQLFNFVEKTLAKVYGRGMTFEVWMDVNIDKAKGLGWMTSDEAQENMQHKRTLHRHYKKKMALRKEREELKHGDLRHPELGKLK